MGSRCSLRSMSRASLKHIWRGLGLVLCGFAALTACSSPSKLDQEPRITLVNLQPVQIQLLEQRYLATIRIQNPNPVALPIRGLDYAISINGSQFAEGVSNQRITIPAYGEKTMDLGVTSTIIKLLGQIRGFSKNYGTVTYGISGTLGIDGLSHGVPFKRDGEINLDFERPPQGRSA
jgi:LEA14-like dessication related protein